MASKSLVSRSCILLLLISVFLISIVQAHGEETIIGDPSGIHTHEDGVTHSHDNDTPGHEHSEDEAIMNETIYNGGSVVELCGINSDHDYRASLRIGSVFIILATSAAGIFTPILLFRSNPITEGSLRDWVLVAGRFFGTGIIMATAFIHMLPESFTRFQSDCLTGKWHSYHAFGGLFCMLASFALQLIELTAISRLNAIAKRNVRANGLNTEELAGAKLEEKGTIAQNHTGFNANGHVRSAGFLENEQTIRNVSTLILELGIIMHSVIIGITLGTINSETFNTLLVALVFHQFFEGIALGTRINDLNCKSLFKPVFMGTLFSVMTPVGIAIGMGIRIGINPTSAVLAQGILGSLSAGILLYNAYVSLMSIEINHNSEFRKSSIGRKIFCFLCMYIGAAIMAVIGIWT